MKVLLVNDKGYFFGGVEQLINDTAAGLISRGHEVHLLATEAVPTGRENLSAPFTSRSRLEFGASEDAWRRQLARVIEHIEPDVIYLHKLSTNNVLEALASEQPILRYVHDHDLYCPRRHKYFPFTTKVCDHRLGLHCIVHGCLFTPQGRFPGLPGLIDLREKARSLAANRALPAFLVGSEWMRRMMLVNRFRSDQVKILPPVPAGLEREPQPQSDAPLVLYVGQVIRGKGVDLLLRALTMVRHEVRAVIIGTGNHLQACVDLARTLGLGSRVTFLGWVNHNLLAEYYRRARVIAVPSRWPEPFGMVGLEAMWASRPTVGFATGGISDWLVDGETGFVVPERDWQAFGHALDELVADHQLASRLGAGGWERARTHYRHETYIARTEEYLEAVQNQTKSGDPDAT